MVHGLKVHKQPRYGMNQKGGCLLAVWDRTAPQSGSLQGTSVAKRVHVTALTNQREQWVQRYQLQMGRRVNQRARSVCQDWAGE